MDWNWFFSALAQSMAAIVGLIGAFVVTKIVANQADFRQLNGRVEDLLALAAKFRQRADGLSFDWYNGVIREHECQKISESMAEPGAERSVEEYYSDADFSPFDNRQLVFAEIDKAKVAQRRKRPTQSLMLSQLVESSLRTSPPWDALGQERDRIEELIVDICHLGTELKNAEKAMVGDRRSLATLSFSLAALLLLFLVGVVYPLAFLPSGPLPQISASLSDVLGQVFSLQAAFLVAPTVIFLVMLGYFWRLNRSLQFEDATVAKVQAAQVLEDYSPFFRFRADNDLWQQQRDQKARGEGRE